jgi:hypothetical protein
MFGDSLTLLHTAYTADGTKGHSCLSLMYAPQRQQWTSVFGEVLQNRTRGIFLVKEELVIIIGFLRKYGYLVIGNINK